jgi:hypothetical protein
MQNIPPELLTIIMEKIDHFQILEIVRFNTEFTQLLIYANIGLDLSVKDFYHYYQYSDSDSDNPWNIDDGWDLKLLKQVNRVNDSDLKLLAGIKRLDITYCRRVTDKGLKHLTGIKHLNISWVYITDKTLRYFRRIDSISLRWCKKITGNGIINMQPKKVYLGPRGYYTNLEIFRIRRAGITVVF